MQFSPDFNHSHVIAEVAAVLSRHLNEDVLMTFIYARGYIDASEQHRIETHLELCDECATLHNRLLDESANGDDLDSVECSNALRLAMASLVPASSLSPGEESSSHPESHGRALAAVENVSGSNTLNEALKPASNGSELAAHAKASAAVHARRQPDLWADLKLKCAECARGGRTALWHYNQTTRNWWFSSTMSDLLGFDRDVFAEDPIRWLRRVHPEDVRRLVETLEPYIQGERSGSFVTRHRVRAEDGTWVVVNCAGESLTRENGESVVAGTHTILSEVEVLAEQAINTTRHTLVFAKKAIEGRGIVFAYVNEAFARLFDKTPSQIIGLTDEELGLKASEICGFRKADRAILCSRESEQLIFDKEKLTLPNGRVVVLQTIKEKVELASGELMLLGVATDLTEKFALEGQVRMTRAVLASVLDSFEMDIWIKGIDGNFIQVNRHFAQTYDFSDPKELIGRVDSDFWPPEVVEMFRKDDEQVIREGKPKVEYVKKIQWPDGGESLIMMTKSPIMTVDRHETIGLLGVSEVVWHKEPSGKATDYDREICRARIRQSQDVVRGILSNATWTKALLA